MSLKAKAINGAVSTGSGQMIKFAIRTASLAVLARYLGPEDYGLVALAMALTGFLRVFQDAGLSMATVQAPVVSALASSSMYWLNVALGALVLLLICVAAPAVHALYDRPELLYLFPCFGLVAFISSFRAQRVALLQRDLKFGLLASAEVWSHAAGVTAGIALAVAGYGLWALVAIELVQAGVHNLLLARRHRWKPEYRYSYAEIKPFLQFGTSIMASNTLAHCSKGLDAVLIGSVLGPAPLGLYNRAQNILNGPLRQLITPLATVARAAVFRTTHDERRFQRGVTSILGLIALGGGVIVLTCLALAEPIVLVLLGRDWLACVPIFMLLMPFAFVEPCSVFLHSVLIARGEASALLKWKLFSLLIIVLSLLAGLPGGLTGVALSYAAGGVLVRFPLLFGYTSRKASLPLSRLFGSVLPTFLACAIGSTVAVLRHLGNPHPSPAEAGLTLTLALFAFGVGLLLFRSSRHSLRLVSDLVRERLRLPVDLPSAAARVVPPAD